MNKYLAVCKAKGYVPKFDMFLDKTKKGEYTYTKGYYKFLLDFKMFDKNGKILPQEVVVPVFDNEVNKQILEDYVADDKAKAPNDELYGKVVDAMVERGTLTEEQVAKVMENVRFSLIGEVGATALDMAEEATIRMDNLAIARQMEERGDSALDIRMATGWERGADGLWRYEVMDAEVNLYDGNEGTIRKKIAVAEEEEQDFMQQSKADTKELRERTNTYLAEMREKYGVAEGDETDAMTEEEIAHLQSLTGKEIAFEDYKEHRRSELYNRRMALEAQLAYVIVKNTDAPAMILNSRLGHVLKGEYAEQLFKAYPSLKDMEFRFVTDIQQGASAAYAKDRGKAYIELNVKKTPVNMVAPYLMHEVQHAIQDIEGFAQGGNPNMLNPLSDKQTKEYNAMSQLLDIIMSGDAIDKTVKEVFKDNNEIWETLSDEEKSIINDYLQKDNNAIVYKLYKYLNNEVSNIQNTGILGFEGYKKLAGEVEARNVSARLNMSAEERMNTLLSETEDVAREDQIFLREGAEMAMARKKSAQETVSVPTEHHQTAISSADGTKLLKNIDSAIEKYKNDSYPKVKTFLGNIADVLKAQKRGGKSRYATFEAMNGNVFTIRLSDHNATVKNFDDNNEKEGVSIVITTGENKGINVGGDAHIVEYFYDAIKLRKAEGYPLVDILKSIKQALYSGVYKDTTGLAQVEDVNSPSPLSEATGKKRVRHSLITPEMDADYLSAVERGDMATAQQMVMEAAKLAMPNTKVVDENGNPKVVYHQTNHSIYINRETGQNWDELDWRERMEWDERDDWDDYWEE